jgi:excinuclease ABC subunit B
VQPTFAQSTSVPGTRARKPTLDDIGPGTDRTEPQRHADAVSRIRKPSLDEMGSHSNRPIPQRNSPPPGGEGSGVGGATPRTVNIDPRTKAGAYGEQIKGPHKPTLDEMGPHAERGLPVSGKPKPRTPTGPPPHHAEGVSSTRRGEGLGVGGPRAEGEKRTRRGRPRKTGRPGA